jgi:cell division protein FtsB
MLRRSRRALLSDESAVTCVEFRALAAGVAFSRATFSTDAQEMLHDLQQWLEATRCARGAAGARRNRAAGAACLAASARKSSQPNDALNGSAILRSCIGSGPDPYARVPLSLYTVAGVMAAYFIWHGVNGQRGLKIGEEFEQKLEQLRFERNLLKLQRMHWESRLALIKGETVDADILEEEARKRLGRAHKNDVVIFLPAAGAPTPRSDSKA